MAGVLLAIAVLLAVAWLAPALLGPVLFILVFLVSGEGGRVGMFFLVVLVLAFAFFMNARF